MEEARREWVRRGSENIKEAAERRRRQGDKRGRKGSGGVNERGGSQDG